MAYQSLYRRYRPQRFGEVRGQPHVVSALRNAVRDERVSHAYLFSGPRGTGKTSTARIMAKALNCEHLEDGEPCCECESCLAIEHGTSYDLQELDAASNNGVDAMRDLIARAALGSPGRTKVYILDEVHMLSTAASNALLKTLEEPPPHVVFVLATTDPEKVLRTIRSRTQHLEFHLLPADELADHVRWVANDASLDVDDAALDHVLRAGGGSARDTLSALDQVVAAGGVHDSADGAEGLVDAICMLDTGAALKAVAEAVQAGRDPRVLGEALLARLRDLFLHRMGVELDHLPDADRAKVAGWAEQLTDRSVTRALEAVGEALLEMRQAPDPRIPLEVALVRITRVEADESIEGLLARIDWLEQAVRSGGTAPSAGVPGDSGPAGSSSATSSPPAASDPDPPTAPPGASASANRRPGDAARAALASQEPVGAPPRPSGPTTPSDAAPPPPAAKASLPSEPAGPPPSTASAGSTGVASAAGTPGRDALTLAWGDAVLPGLKGLARALYAVGRFLDSDDGQAVFALPNETHRAKCADKQADVEAALAAYFGSPVPLRLVVDPGGDTSHAAPPQADSAVEPNHPSPVVPTDDGGEHIDLTELSDAPSDDRTTLDRVNEVFPGAKLVEGD